MNATLSENSKWYREHRDEIVGRHNGRYIVIADKRVVGDYFDMDEALRETLKTREMGTFNLKKCVPEAEEPVRKFVNVRFDKATV